MAFPQCFPSDGNDSSFKVNEKDECVPISRFKPIENLDLFYESNKNFLQTAYRDINEKKLPRPSILEDYHDNCAFVGLNFDDFKVTLNPNILPILESEQKALYGKRCAAIQKYRSTLHSWKKDIKSKSTNNNPGILIKKNSIQPSSSKATRPVLLRSRTSSNQSRDSSVDVNYSSDSVRSEEELNRVLLSLLQSERNDPSQRWMFTLAKIPPMNASSLDLNIPALRNQIQSSGHVLASLLEVVGKWWIDENQYDPYPQLTMRSIFYSKSQKNDLHLRLMAFLSRSFGSVQENTGVYTGVGGLKPFTEQEKALFKEKYSASPKRFENILKVFPDRSINELIQFYYETKKVALPPYKKWWASSKSSSTQISLVNSLSESNSSLANQANMTSNSGVNDAQGRSIFGKKRLSTESGISVPLNKPASAVEKLKPVKYNFSWLSERPLLAYINENGDPVHRLAYWTPMERIILVNGIIEHGLCLSKLVKLLCEYREEVSLATSASSGGLKRRRDEVLVQESSPDHLQAIQKPFKHSSTPTKALLNAMNKFILEPSCTESLSTTPSSPSSSTEQIPLPSTSIPLPSTSIPLPSTLIPLNSELEVRLFFDLYADTYALHRFVKSEAITCSSLVDFPTFSFTPTPALPSSASISSPISSPPSHHVFPKGPVPGRKASLPITLSSFNFGYEPVTAKAAHAAHYKLAAPVPSRKLSLSLSTNYGLFNSSRYPFKYMELKPRVVSPPLSTRLAEGSPLMNSNDNATSKNPFPSSYPTGTAYNPPCPDPSGNIFNSNMNAHQDGTSCKVNCPSEDVDLEPSSIENTANPFTPAPVSTPQPDSISLENPTQNINGPIDIGPFSTSETPVNCGTDSIDENSSELHKTPRIASDDCLQKVIDVAQGSNSHDTCQRFPADSINN
ncbi:hypothetical protein MDAP_001667 [Mitosporidium daphniae]